MSPLFILQVALFSCFVKTQGVWLENVHCSPRPQIVAIDPAEHKYYPYFVELNRCSGSSGLESPTKRRCIAKQWKDIYVNVYQIVTNNDQPETVRIVQNHTACEPGCVETPNGCNTDYEYWDEDNCKCTCLYDQPPARLGPKEGFRWNPSLCRNECATAPLLCLHINQVWDSEICGCTCKRKVVERCAREKTGLDFDTCQCVDVAAVKHHHRSGYHSRAHMFIALLVGEAFVIIVLVCAIVYWVRKARGINDSNAKDHPESGTEEDVTTDHIAAVPGSMYSLESGVDGCVEDGPPEKSPRGQEIV